MGKIDREVVTVDLDAESIKKDFPILSNSENNKSLVLLTELITIISMSMPIFTGVFMTYLSKQRSHMSQ